MWPSLCPIATLPSCDVAIVCTVTLSFRLACVNLSAGQGARHPIRRPKAVERPDVHAPVVALLQQEQRAARLVRQTLRVLPRDEPVSLAGNDQQRRLDRGGAPGERQLMRPGPGLLVAPTARPDPERRTGQRGQ